MITVVIPAYNEAGAIEETITSARSTLSAIEDYNDFEVIVVDDGSDDSTAQLAEESGAKVVRHPQNKGYGFALKSGISAAKHDIIAIVDSDGTYPIDQIPSLIEPLFEGFDMVVGRRTGKEYRGTLIKSPLRMILKVLVEFTAGTKIPDINSGLRVFRKSDVMLIMPHLCDTFSFTTSLTLSYMMSGKFTKYQEIDYHKRIGTTKVRLFKDSLATLQYIAQSILIYNPIKLFLVLCIVTWVSGLVGGLLAGLIDLRLGILIGMGGLFTGFLIFAIGLLVDSIRLLRK